MEAADAVTRFPFLLTRGERGDRAGAARLFPHPRLRKDPTPELML